MLLPRKERTIANPYPYGRPRKVRPVRIGDVLSGVITDREVRELLYEEIPDYTDVDHIPFILQRIFGGGLTEREIWALVRFNREDNILLQWRARRSAYRN